MLRVSAVRPEMAAPLVYFTWLMDAEPGLHCTKR